MTEEKTKKCPFCGEEILEVAIKCKHCKEDLIQNTVGGNNTKDKKAVSWNLLLFVSASVVILAVVAFLFLSSNQKNEKIEKQIQNDFKEIVKKLILYKEDPTNREPLPDHLDQINVTKKDPWDNFYIYKKTPRNENEPFTLFSAGPNRKKGDSDDVYMNESLINFLKDYFEKETDTINLEKSKAGVGIILREHNDEDGEFVGKYPVFEGTVNDSPASKNEILQYYSEFSSGVFLVKVDGRSTKNLSVEETYKMLNGKEGTKVIISIETSVGGVDVEIIRGVVGN